MTLIIGIASPKGILLGADSVGSDGWTARPLAQEKIVQLAILPDESGLPLRQTNPTPRPLLIGYTHTYRFGQILRYHVSPPDQLPETSAEEYLVGQLVPALRAAVREHGHMSVDKSVESGGTALVAYAGQLFRLSEDWSVTSPRDGVDVVGSGAHVALGAALALVKKGPVERVLRALQVAASVCPGNVGPPWQLVGLREDGTVFDHRSGEQF